MSSEMQTAKVHSPRSSNAPDEGMDLNLSIENGCDAITSVDAPCEAAWPQGRLGDFIELKRGYDLPQAKRCTGDVPLISSSGHSDFHNVAMVKGPGVVTGRYGTIGQVFYVGEDFWPLNTTLYVRDFKGNDPKFISYFLKTIDFFAYSDKAAVPGVNRNHLHEAIVSMPPLDIQLGIAEVLGALDDRIALLHETNATLEAMAQALFKSWFVDFDPVQANAGTRAATLPAELQGLFPSTFTDTPQGPVPEGWEMRLINEVCELGRGSSPRPIQKFMGDDVPWIKIADATASDGMFIFETKEKIIQAGVVKSTTVKPGDLIMSNSATCGVPVFVEIHGCVHDGWLYFKNYHFISKHFLFFWLRKISNHLINIADGSVQKNLNIALVSSQKILCPSAEVIAEFEKVVEPTLARIRENCLQAQTLATLRDTLLPRLISGQLRLPDAESALAEAVT